jgi:hypothetical protein
MFIIYNSNQSLLIFTFTQVKIINSQQFMLELVSDLYFETDNIEKNVYFKNKRKSKDT